MNNLVALWRQFLYSNKGKIRLFEVVIVVIFIMLLFVSVPDIVRKINTKIPSIITTESLQIVDKFQDTKEELVGGHSSIVTTYYLVVNYEGKDYNVTCKSIQWANLYIGDTIECQISAFKNGEIDSISIDDDVANLPSIPVLDVPRNLNKSTYLQI